MNDWSMLLGALVCFVTGFICYIKGFDDGLDINDEDIEKIITKALKRYKEENWWV